MAALDVQKAFDTLQHQSLLDKLHMMGVAKSQKGYVQRDAIQSYLGRENVQKCIPSPTCADDMLAMATDMGDAQSDIPDIVLC